jgi:hypothetical protein
MVALDKLVVDVSADEVATEPHDGVVDVVSVPLVRDMPADGFRQRAYAPARFGWVIRVQPGHLSRRHVFFDVPIAAQQDRCGLATAERALAGNR